MEEVISQENEQGNKRRYQQFIEKLRAVVERGRFQEIGQKKMRDSEKKRLIRKQRLAKYSNIVERKQDVVFENQQFIKQFRNKMEREKLEQIQQEYQKSQQICRPRNNQMLNRNNQVGSYNPKESYDNIIEDYTEIENFLEFQSQKNILDRVEKKELQLIQMNDQNSSLSFSQSINLAFNSILPQQKRLFPFENYLPKYKENELNQLTVDEQYSEIDGGIPGSGLEINCFTQYNDQIFGFALNNGTIMVRDVVSKKSYEVNCQQNYNVSSNNVRLRDIVCLQLTPDLRHILACHESGAISMYDFKYSKMIFYIKNLFKYSSSELESRNESNLVIIDFKVIAQNFQKDEVYLISVNARGDCILAKIFKGFLSYETQVVYLMKNELFPLTSINILGRGMQSNYFQYDYDREEDFIAAISSPEKLFIIRIKLQKMKAKLIHKFVEKMDTMVKKVKNSFAWGEIKLGKEYHLMFLASFSNFLQIGILSKVQEESVKDQGIQIIQLGYFI